jgi:hypothetical protein
VSEKASDHGWRWLWERAVFPRERREEGAETVSMRLEEGGGGTNSVANGLSGDFLTGCVPKDRERRGTREWAPVPVRRRVVLEAERVMRAIVGAETGLRPPFRESMRLMLEPCVMP